MQVVLHHVSYAADQSSSIPSAEIVEDRILTCHAWKWHLTPTTTIVDEPLVQSKDRKMHDQSNPSYGTVSQHHQLHDFEARLQSVRGRQY